MSSAGRQAALIVPGVEALDYDEQAEASRDRRKALFWEVLDRLAVEYGVDLVIKPTRSAARWDESRMPPLLLEATVRFKRPGYKRRRGAEKRRP